MSDTPRTDSVAMDFRRQTVGGTESAIEFARKLERELYGPEAIKRHARRHVGERYA